MTQISLGNIRINWRGAYDNMAHYVRHDAVFYKGSSYVAKHAINNVIPTQGDNWDLMAAGSDQLIEQGDLLTHNGTMPVRLPRGNNTQVLQMVGTTPSWRNQALDPSRQVWKLSNVNQSGSIDTRVYLMANGLIKACGSGTDFSNGNPAEKSIYIPSTITPEDPDIRFVEVYSGGFQHYALTENGEVWSWGRNLAGQLGHGDTVARALPKRIEYFVKYGIKIARIITNRPNYYDSGFAYFLTTDGRLYGCGHNGYGNMGIGTTVNQYTPIRCGALEDIVDVGISASPCTVYAINKTGALWVWGCNNFGQLGLGDTTNRSSPTLNTTMTNVYKAIPTCGYLSDGTAPVGSGFVIKKDGSIWSTGNNNNGQLGLGDTTNRTSFTQITHKDKFTDIAVSDGKSCTVGALTEKGHVYLWGANSYGQLGNGTTTQINAPYWPNHSFQGKVKKIKICGCFGYNGTIIQADNQLWAAGYSSNGNLGIGKNTSSNTRFTRVLGVSGKIVDWNLYGISSRWGIGLLYEDGRVDACGINSTYGETGTQTGNLHDVFSLKNVIF
ncbi:RCC1 domain-containing protein [Bartonella sp. B17]